MIKKCLITKQNYQNKTHWCVKWKSINGFRNSSQTAYYFYSRTIIWSWNMRLTMQRSYINEIVGIFLLATLLPSAFGKLASQPCCPESNIYTNSCQHNSIQRPIMLKCHHEKFMLDPVANVNDNFTIDKYGNLIVLSSDDTEIPRDK